MAHNRVYETKFRLPLTPTDGGLNGGDPCLVGQLPGVSLSGAAATVQQSIETIGVYNLTVQAVNAAGNVAIAQGDIIYYVVGATPVLSKNATGVRYGYAMDALASGATGIIRVILGY